MYGSNRKSSGDVVRTTKLLFTLRAGVCNRDNFIELLAVQHKEITNADLMEVEA